MVTSRGSRYGRVDNSIMLGISTCYNILLYYTSGGGPMSCVYVCDTRSETSDTNEI